jgi:hypothetical protein
MLKETMCPCAIRTAPLGPLHNTTHWRTTKSTYQKSTWTNNKMESSRNPEKIPAHSKYLLIPAHSKYLLIPAHSKYLLIPAHSKHLLIPAHSKHYLISAHSKHLLISAHSEHLLIPAHSKHLLVSTEATASQHSSLHHRRRHTPMMRISRIISDFRRLCWQCLYRGAVNGCQRRQRHKRCVNVTYPASMEISAGSRTRNCTLMSPAVHEGNRSPTCKSSSELPTGRLA